MLKNKVKWRAFAAISITLVAGLAVSACSSGSGGSSGAGGSDKITFRLIASEGSGFSSYPDARAGAEAAADAINKSGGVNGKQIDFSFCNARADVNQTVTCDREAVSDKVDALVGSVDIYGTQSMPVLEAGGIPTIGNIAISEADATSAISYPLHGGNLASIAAAPSLCKGAGFTKFGVIRNEFAVSVGLADLAMTSAKSIGIDTGEVVAVPSAGVTDYSPFAEKVKDEGIDCAYVVMGPAALSAFYQATAATGVKAQFAAPVFTFAEQEAKALGADLTNGLWATSPLPSPSDPSAAIKEYNADLTADGVAADDVSLRKSAGVNAWLSVYAAAAVAKTIKGEVTSKAMIAALKSTKPIDVKGVLTWDPASLGSSALGKFPRLPDAQVNALVFENGKLEAPKVAPVEKPLSAVR